MFGPANVWFVPHDSPDDGQDPQSCRMFTARNMPDFDALDDDEYIRATVGDDLDWFVGHCEICDLQYSYDHAVRMPIEGGGWLGCYCSWNCVRKDIIPKESEYTDAHSIRNYLVTVFEEKIMDVGIYDRPIAEIERDPIDPVRQIREDIKNYPKETAMTFLENISDTYAQQFSSGQPQAASSSVSWSFNGTKGRVTPSNFIPPEYI